MKQIFLLFRFALLIMSLLIALGLNAQPDEFAQRRLTAWHTLIKENQKIKVPQKLENVNVFFNQMEYQPDSITWNKQDYWATPREFIVAGQGDCEDFAIAKFDTLRQLGVPEQNLLLCYTKIKLPDKPSYQPHILLAYLVEPGEAPLLLDNFNKEIVPADKRGDLKSLYCFNHLGFWQLSKHGKARHIGKSTDIKPWQEMEKRKQSEEAGQGEKLHESD